MRPSTLLSLSLLTLACGSRSDLLPDGGRPRQVCTHQVAVLTVKVMDSAGMPAPGATLTAVNVGTGKTVTAITDSQGLTRAVDDELGTGTVRLSAESGASVTQTAQVELSCGECSCAVNPSSVVLQLSP